MATSEATVVNLPIIFINDGGTTTRRYPSKHKVFYYVCPLPTSLRTSVINVDQSASSDKDVSGQIVDEKLEVNKKILRDFLELDYNWNTYGAKKFDVSLITKVEAILDKIIKQPDVFPTARESVQLEFDKPNGDYLEFEIYDDKISTLSIINGQEEELDIDLNQINNYIRKFYA